MILALAALKVPLDPHIRTYNAKDRSCFVPVHAYPATLSLLPVRSRDSVLVCMTRWLNAVLSTATRFDRTAQTGDEHAAPAPYAYG